MLFLIVILNKYKEEIPEQDICGDARLFCCKKAEEPILL